MQYYNNESLLYSDTPVPDIFITEYLPTLSGNDVKVYIYSRFLAGKSRKNSIEDMSHVLDMPTETVKDSLRRMENLDILSQSVDGVVLRDLKEREINRLYHPKSTVTPETATAHILINAERRQAIDTINAVFFQGMMSPSWFPDIDHWFDRFGFDGGAMVMLFRQCHKYGKVNRHYILKVAEDWHSRGIVTSLDAEHRLSEREKAKAVEKQIQKKLRQFGALDEYHVVLIDKWVNKYHFSFDMIEEALRKSTAKRDVGFDYYDKIITSWYNNGCVSVEKIREDVSRFYESRAPSNAASYKDATKSAQGVGMETSENAGSRSGASSRTGARSGFGFTAAASSPSSGRRKYSQSHFSQREYDPDEFDEFMKSITVGRNAKG